MIDLLKIEFYKFRKNSVVIVLTALFFLFMPTILLYVKDTFAHIPPPFPSSKDFYEFPNVWDYQGYAGNWMVSFLLGFLVIYSFTSEVANKTMRQCIINGWTRQEYWRSKVYTLVLFSAVATIVYAVSTIIIGLVHTEDVDLELILDNNFAIVRFFLMCLGYTSFALFIASWIRKGTLAVLLYFAYVMFIEQIFRGIHLYYFKNQSVLYYPINIIEDLMPNPIFKAPDNWLSKDIGFKVLIPYYEAAGLTTLMVALFLYLSYRFVVYKDL